MGINSTRLYLGIACWIPISVCVLIYLNISLKDTPTIHNVSEMSLGTLFLINGILGILSGFLFCKRKPHLGGFSGLIGSIALTLAIITYLRWRGDFRRIESVLPLLAAFSGLVFYQIASGNWKKNIKDKLIPIIYIGVLLLSYSCDPRESDEHKIEEKSISAKNCISVVKERFGNEAGFRILKARNFKASDVKLVMGKYRNETETVVSVHYATDKSEALDEHKSCSCLMRKDDSFIILAADIDFEDEE